MKDERKLNFVLLVFSGYRDLLHVIDPLNSELKGLGIKPCLSGVKRGHGSSGKNSRLSPGSATHLKV